MSKYLITGGAGFIGSHLADFLVARGDRVIVLDDLSTGRRGNLPAGTELVVGDISSAAKFDGVDGCFHLAAIASVQQYKNDWPRAVAVNLAGSVAVLDAAARKDVPVVYASSAAVYGDNPDVPLAEDAATRPISGYGADKLAVEMHAAAMREALGLKAVGLRFFNVFGPRQSPGSPYSGVISIFLDRLRAGQGLSVYGDGEQTRDFVYVGDVVEALVRAMERAMGGGGGVFNICSGRATSINHLAEVLGGLPGFAEQMEYFPERAGDIRRSFGNPGLAEQELGFRCRVSLQDGLRKTAEWFASQ